MHSSVRLLVALFTFELASQRARAAFGRHNPWPVDPRRAMAHVLRVAAFQVGDPVPLVVLMKAGDASFHKDHDGRDLVSSSAMRCFNLRSSCQRTVSSRIVAAMIHDASG